MKSLSEIQPKSSFAKIKIRVYGTRDAKDVLIAYQRAFNYKCSGFMLYVPQIKSIILINKGALLLSDKPRYFPTQSFRKV